jgi:hypothetical protein
VANRVGLIACRCPRAYRPAVAIKYARVLLIAGWLAGLCLSAPLVAGCGATNTPADSVVSANQRLGGAWRLQSFSPSVPLDLPLQGVLSAELGQLILTFDHGQYSAVGPGVNLSDRYEITSASGDQVSLILYDAHNVGYHFSAQFAGQVLQFQSNDKPWIGFGNFARA